MRLVSSVILYKVAVLIIKVNEYITKNYRYI